MKQKEIKIHPNGFIARDHNKRITFFQKEEKDGFIIDFKSIIKNKKATHTCYSEIIKDKIGWAVLPISNESMELLVNGYLKFKEKLNDQNP